MTSDGTKKPFELIMPILARTLIWTRGWDNQTEVQVNINFKLNDHTGFIRQHSKVFPLYAIAIGADNQTSKIHTTYNYRRKI